MLGPTTRPATSEFLRVGASGYLLRLTPEAGTCFPVLGLRADGPTPRLDQVYFRTDPVRLPAAPAPAPMPTPAPTTPAPSRRWLLVLLLVAAALLF